MTLPSPTSALSVLAGIVLGWAGILLLVVASGAVASVTSLFVGLWFAFPIGILVHRGHFGRSEFDVPSPGAMIVIAWVFGVAPSLTAVTGDVVARAYFSNRAVQLGLAVAVLFLILFAFAAGSWQGYAGDGRGSRVGPVFQSDYFSNWTARNTVSDSNIAFALSTVYRALVVVMPSLGALLVDSDLRYIRINSRLLVLTGFVAVFALSSRRAWLFSLLLILVITRVRVRRIKAGWVLAAILASVVAFGPLTVAYRTLLGEETGTSVGEAVKSAVVGYATDPAFREQTDFAMAENIRGRWNMADVYFGVCEYTLNHGPNLSPSPLASVVRSVPSAVWPAKNAIAATFDFKTQLLSTGAFPPYDLSIPPIAEAIFQAGFFAAGFCGVLYGFLVRGLNMYAERAFARLDGAMLWTGLFVGSAFFDAGIGGVVDFSREPMFIAAALFVLSHVYKPLTAEAPVQRPATQASWR